MKKWSAFAAWTIIAALSGSAAAQQAVSPSDIINALDPGQKKPLTRSFKRGIQVEKGQDDQAAPTINLYINFEFNSAKLTNDGQISLDNLGKALTDPRLEKFHFLIAGHTDSKGTDGYNQTLSETRAAAVKDYLVSTFHIDTTRLESKGFGKSQLLDAQHPENGINRRVQITTLTN